MALRCNLLVPGLQRFTADILRDAVTLTFDPLTFNVCSVPVLAVLWSNSV